MATDDDFLRKMAEIKIPEITKESIMKNKRVEVRNIRDCRIITKEGLFTCKDRCHEFLSVVMAYDDHISGRIIFTDYSTKSLK